MAKKQSKKQIKAELINEVSASYRERINRLENKVKHLSEELQRKVIEINELKQRYIKAEDELDQYKDWNRRLQEFMDMNPDEREKVFKTFDMQNKLSECLESYKHIFNLLGIF